MFEMLSQDKQEPLEGKASGIEGILNLFMYGDCCLPSHSTPFPLKHKT